MVNITGLSDGAAGGAACLPGLAPQNNSSGPAVGPLPHCPVNTLASQLAGQTLNPVNNADNAVMNNGGRDRSLQDVQKLQQQLADIKEQTMCPVGCLFKQAISINQKSPLCRIFS